jgi:potassium-transporting ATPase KdpC subunit
MKTPASSLPFWQLWGARADEAASGAEQATPRSSGHGPAKPDSPRTHSAEESLARTARAALLGTIVLATVCCGVYPLIVFGIAQVVFPHQANGSLLVDARGVVRGSHLLGQGFTADKYFHPRPSTAGNSYDASNSSGSNLGPTSQNLSDAIKERIAAYRAENGLKESDAVPADAVTASGSGLDPHISVRNAELQAPRIAKARGLSEEKVRSLIARNTAGPDLGFLGEPGVNVLKLNLSLDSLR